MKLAYMAWSREIEPATLFRFAVLKTLQQKLGDSTRLLRGFVRDPRFEIQHSLLYSKNIDQDSED